MIGVSSLILLMDFHKKGFLQPQQNQHKYNIFNELYTVLVFNLKPWFLIKK